MTSKNVYHTSIWEEEAEADNPFATKAAYCHGYDVYGDLLGKASWVQYLFMMFKGHKPSAFQASLLENLAVAFANCGPRDHSVRAAMNGGVGGSVAAGSLMAALAVGAGQYGGAHEVYHCVSLWNICGQDVESWARSVTDMQENHQEDIWLAMEHAPGFDPNGVSCPGIVLDTLNILAESSEAASLKWLKENCKVLEETFKCPLALTGVAGAAFHDLGFTAQEAEMLFLIFRLPGAAVHALEQQKLGWKKFPFVGDMIHLENDPGFMGMPQIKGVNL